MSHRGEWSAGLFATIEWIAQYRAITARTDDTMDENTPARATVEFWIQLKDLMSVSMGKGWGNQFHKARFPHGGVT